MLLEEGVCYDQCVLLANSFSLCPLHFVLQGQISLLFTWGQTMVEVMKIMATSFKRSHACTATLSTPNPAASHHCPTPLLETWTLLGKSDSVSSGVTAPFSWVLVHTSFCCALQESISQSCVSSGSSMLGLMVTSSKKTYAIPKSAAPRAPVPAAVHC